MKSCTLKPFDDGKYLSEEESLKLIESIPIPKDDSGDVDTSEVKQDAPETDNLDLEGRIIQLDSLPADKGSKKTQDQWFDYWKNISDGRIFASMPDYYRAFKQLKNKFEHGPNKDKQLAKTIIDSLREDFDWPSKNNWLVSSTRIKYQPDKENAKIIHHYNCNNKSAIQQHNIIIPEYVGVLIPDVLNDTKGLTYLQTFLGTKDNKEAIMQNLEFISNKPRNEIKIWTPPIKEYTGYITRKALQERASGFGYGGEFRVDGDNGLDSGRSRGVRIGAAGAKNNRGAT